MRPAEQRGNPYVWRLKAHLRTARALPGEDDAEGLRGRCRFMIVDAFPLYAPKGVHDHE